MAGFDPSMPAEWQTAESGNASRIWHTAAKRAGKPRRYDGSAAAGVGWGEEILPLRRNGRRTAAQFTASDELEFARLFAVGCPNASPRSTRTTYLADPLAKIAHRLPQGVLLLVRQRRVDRICYQQNADGNRVDAQKLRPTEARIVSFRPGQSTKSPKQQHQAKRAEAELERDALEVVRSLAACNAL